MIPTNILTSIVNLPAESQLATAYLQPIDLAPGEKVPWASSRSQRGAVAFQYWPESVNDSKAGGWQPRTISGGSHPIYQWGSGGERVISFTSVFSTDTAPDMRLLTGVNLANTHIYSSQANAPVNGLELGKYDLDLRVAVAWLRWFMYPNYGDSSGNQPVYDPAKALLVLPNSGIGHTGVDYIVSVMDQCDVTYQEFFESGVPRLMEVSLSFKESVQEGRRVRFHSRSDMRLANYASVFLPVSGGIEL